MGTCTVGGKTLHCEVTQEYLASHPIGVHGSVSLWANTTFKNKEDETHTFNFGSNTQTVTVGRNPNWCTENCEFSNQGAGKWGSYDPDTDTIVWTVQIPAGKDGMDIGKKVTVTDTAIDGTNYQLVQDNTYPRVLEAGQLQYNGWDRQTVSGWAAKTSADVKWTNNNTTVSFTTAAGKGKDYTDSAKRIQGTTGSFYQVQWKVKVNSPGKLDQNGNRTWTNTADYQIEGSESKTVKGSATRLISSANVVGTNYGRVSITKDLSGDTTLSPSFTVHYKATGADNAEGDLTIKSGQTIARDFFKGTTVTFSEVTPTGPDNVTWAKPQFVDANGNKSDTLTLNVNDFLGTTAKFTLENKATLHKGAFKAKKVVENPDGVPGVKDASYALNYSYPADNGKGFGAGSGTLTLKGDGTVATSDQLPVGAVLTLSEGALPNVPGATWGTPELSTKTLTIGDKDSVDLVTVTNSITQDTGKFNVKKELKGNGIGLVPEGTEFTVHYTWDAINGFPGGEGDLKVKAGETSADVKAPAGAEVTLSELKLADPDGGTYGEPEFDKTTFTVVKATTVNINLTNPVSWNNGEFEVKKVVDGDGKDLVPSDMAFTVKYTYTLPEKLNADPSTGEGTLTVKNDGEAVTSDPLPQGTKVHLEETDIPDIAGGTWTSHSFDPSDFTISDKTVASVTLTNTIERDLGALSIKKTVSGSGESLVKDGTEFTVKYSYEAGPGFEAGSGEVTVKSGEEASLVKDLPAGATVTLEEVTPAKVEGGTWSSPTFKGGNIVTVGKDKTAEVVLDNPIELNKGDFSIVKKIDGSGAGLVGKDTTFTVAYSYPKGDGYPAGQGTLAVKADGQAVTSVPIPFGAKVTLEEAEPAAVEGGDWKDAKFSQDEVTIGDETTVAVTLTNTIDKTPKTPPTQPTNPTQPTQPAQPGQPGQPGGHLPQTGATVTAALAAGLSLLLLGAAAVMIARKRRR